MGMPWRSAGRMAARQTSTPWGKKSTREQIVHRAASPAPLDGYGLGCNRLKDSELWHRRHPPSGSSRAARPASAGSSPGACWRVAGAPSPPRATRRGSPTLRRRRDRALALDLDVTDAAQIAAAVHAAEARFGAHRRAREQRRLWLPGLRRGGRGRGNPRAVRGQRVRPVRHDARRAARHAGARRGHVINITSVAGFVGFPGSGYYAATKHAVEGWSDALAAEVGPLGIKVTCVEPGPFRTDWAGRSLRQTPSRIADYAETVGRPPASPARRQRQPAGRSGARRRGDHPHHRDRQPAAPSGARRLRLRCRDEEAEGDAPEIEAWRETAPPPTFRRAERASQAVDTRPLRPDTSENHNDPRVAFPGNAKPR